VPTIEVTRQAREELRELIKTRQLPPETRKRVSRVLLTLDEFPRAGKQLSGVWRDCRALIGPWGWLIVVYMYIEAEDRVVVIAFHDARTSDAAIAVPDRSF
jgi:mRNA-degrading endonuclease RelE of RelBE toxin-antitoxin system